jgi:hypothetical protein
MALQFSAPTDWEFPQASHFGLNLSFAARLLSQPEVSGRKQQPPVRTGAKKEKPMTVSRRGLRYFLLAAVLALSGCGMMAKSSSSIAFSGRFSGANEVPPTSSAGTGTLEATLNKDTNQLHWRVVYSDLSGPATAAHFHGPAATGKSAGVVLGFKSAQSPIEGDATLTPVQAADVLAGLWYANVHTRANPGGEIRAQLSPAH